MATAIIEKTFRIAHPDEQQILDVFGPKIQFLTASEQDESGPCLLRGIIPAGASVPLHSHADDERFYVISGDVEVYIESGWTRLKVGDFVEIPGDLKHGFRNRSDAAATFLVQTTGRLGKFFKEVGRPLLLESAYEPPTREQIGEMVSIARRYDYWLATPEENAAIGIVLA